LSLKALTLSFRKWKIKMSVLWQKHLRFHVGQLNKAQKIAENDILGKYKTPKGVNRANMLQR